jgi:D-alanyl-lipoteichoic acid acyltransferase DltB (MBOAT superfamily)
MFPCKYQIVYLVDNIWFVYSVKTPCYLYNIVVCVMLLALHFTFIWIVGVVEFRQFRRSLRLESICGQIADTVCVCLCKLCGFTRLVSIVFSSEAYMMNMLARRMEDRTPFTCW